MVHFAEPAIYTLQEKVVMSLNITYNRSIMKEGTGDTIEVSCCSKGNSQWKYALKVVSSIANKSSTPPSVYFDWGGSRKCVMRISGSWNAESMTTFLRKASRPSAIKSGNFNGRRVRVFNHDTEEYEYQHLNDDDEIDIDALFG
jgi:hypothetical protein